VLSVSIQKRMALSSGRAADAVIDPGLEGMVNPFLLIARR
jgi:hypothetical protein